MTTLDIVQQMHVEGRQRWPSVAVTEEDFRRHCEQLCEDGRQLAKARAWAADIYLCCACSNGDPVALAIFQQHAEEVVRGAIARVHQHPEFIRDTLQEFWQKLLVGPDARVRSYRGSGPFLAWLRLCAARLAIDRSRAVRALTDRETDLGNCIAEQVFGPESTLTRARFYTPFRSALQHAIASISHKERNLLRMHVVEHCSIDQIGRAHHVHRATAARWLEQARTRIQQSVRAELEMAGSHLTDSEFDSVARVLGRDLDFDVCMFPTHASIEGSSTTR